MMSPTVLDEILSRGQGFSHRQHLELTWRCLENHTAEQAFTMVSDAIRGLATEHGVPGKYHATITSGWVHCVAVHRERWPADSFDEFIARNPQLLDPKLLEHFYTPNVLFSDAARTAIAAPDRRALPALAAG